MNFLRHALLVPLFVIPAQAHVADEFDTAFDAAMALKQKSAYHDGASAFEALAKAHPDAPRAHEALAEGGVCWFALGKSQQILHRNTPQSRESFATGLKIFSDIVKDFPTDPVAGRAQFMVGSTQLSLDDPASAKQSYDFAVEHYKADPKYGPKFLQRRSDVRRSLLDAQGSLEDLRTYVKEFPKGEDIDYVKKLLLMAQPVGKPAPTLLPETWAMSEPLSLEKFKAQGELVILYFFGSWCPKCAKEKEFIKDLDQRYALRNVHLIGVMHPWQENDGKTRHTVESATAFVAESGLKIPLFSDSGSSAGATARAYSVESLPDLVLIDRSGRVRWHDHPANLLDSTIEKLLIEDPSTAPPAPSVPAHAPAPASGPAPKPAPPQPH